MTVFKGEVKCENLQSVLDAVTVLVEECRVFFEDDSVRIRGTDKANVSMVLVEISESAFDNAEIGSEDTSWNFSKMADMVNTGGKDADVELEVAGSNLLIDILDLSFTLSLIDPDHLDNDQEKPVFDLPAEIVLDSSVFERGVHAADLVSDHVEFGIDEEESAFYMEAKGDVNEVILKKSKRDLSTLTLEGVSSTFSVNSLKEFTKAIPSETQINIEIGNEFPADISFEIMDGDATVTYFISPRIGPDD